MEVDVLVVGSGCGGLTAAISAKKFGSEKVLLIEKANVFGGTSATSGGVIWIPQNMHAINNGAQDSFKDAFAYLEATTPAEEFNPHLVSTFLNKGPEMVRFLDKETDVAYQSMGHYPDYFADAPGAKLGDRALEPVPFSGDKLEKDYFKLHPSNPMTVLFGRYAIDFDQVHAFSTQAPGWISEFIKIFFGYWSDIFWRIKTKRSRKLCFGSAAIARLLYSAKKAGIDLRLQSKLLDIEIKENKVVGALVNLNGENIKIKTNKGIVLAMGGFGKSQTLREKYLPKPTNKDWGCEPTTNTGDWIEIANRINAKLKFMDKAWWVTTLKAPNEDFPRLSDFEKAMPGNYTINKSGKRIANESQNYLTFMLDVLEKQSQGESCNPMYMIFDASYRKKYPVGPLMPGKFYPDFLINKSWFKSKFLTKAKTIDELAIKLSINSEELAKTIRKVNQFAESGIDTEYHRGQNARDIFFGDPDNKPNPCLGPIKKGPFYAMELNPGEFATCGGFEINEHGAVLDNNNAPIEGLYATGNCTAALLPRYPGPGATLGPAMTFGYLAGKKLNLT